jgi:phosphohistidine phosphatase
MELDLYILRHADAEDSAASDFQRELTQKGREQSRRVAAYMKEFDLKPELILTSPYVRARQTAEIVAEDCGLEEPVVEEEIGAGFAPDCVITTLSSYARENPSLMIVGHNPDLTHLGHWLLGMLDGGGLHVRKASLMQLHLTKLSQGAGTLEFFLPVRYMSAS